VVEESGSEVVVNPHAARWLRRLDRDQRLVNSDDFEGELAVRHRP